jgi:hypothetical protein
MIEMQPLNETALAREQLSRMSDGKSVIHKVAHVLDLIARSSVGLGEVLQDYARQACSQLHDFLGAADRIAHSAPSQPDDREALQNVHFTLKAIQAVLQRMPAAMLRNKAESIGDKERLSRADIAELTDAFLRSPDVARLLATENSGHALASLVAGGNGMAPEPERHRASANA